MVRKYLLTTLGCKVNQYESEQLRELLEAHGFRPAQRGDIPDVAVVNTCAVTAGAERSNRHAIRRAARGGRTPVVVVGCGAAADADSLRQLPGVAAVLGHDVNVCAELRKLLATRLDAEPVYPSPTAARSPMRVDRSPPVTRYEESMKPAPERPEPDTRLPGSADPSGEFISGSISLVKPHALTDRIESFAGHQRAFLKVQDGCDASCTYCIIPRLRPVLRSKPVEAAVAEARDLVKAGHREVIVTGIFLGAYGRSTAIRRRWPAGRSPLAALLAALSRVEGLERVRLSSLEAGDVDEELLETIACHRSCVPHLHLPLQSGCPSILRRMNRQYTREAFVDLVGRVRRTLDRPAVTTDIIVGFPGESDEDFEATLEVARCAAFSKIHSFPFSPREQTAAARWRHAFVPAAMVWERMQRLAALERELSCSFRRQFVGEAERVIVERTPEPEGTFGTDGPIRQGRGDRYFEIHFVDPLCRPGDLVCVRVDRVTPTRTHGTVIPTGSRTCPPSGLCG